MAGLHLHNSFPTPRSPTRLAANNVPDETEQPEGIHDEHPRYPNTYYYLPDVRHLLEFAKALGRV